MSPPGCCYVSELRQFVLITRGTGNAYKGKSPEGDGDAANCQLRLRKYIDQHLVLIESYGKEISVSESGMKR